MHGGGGGGSALNSQIGKKAKSSLEITDLLTFVNQPQTNCGSRIKGDQVLA